MVGGEVVKKIRNGLFAGRSLLRTTRVIVGPPVRWLQSAAHGALWKKRIYRPELGEAVTFRTQQGGQLSGRLYVGSPGTRAVIMLHGWDPLGQEHGYYIALAHALRKRGYTVLTFNLPGYPGSYIPETPLGFNLATLVDAVHAAVSFLRRTKLVDAERIALFGHSYGAGLVVPALAADSDLWKGIIHGPSIWVEERITGADGTERSFFHERYWRYMTVKEPIPLEVYLQVKQDLYLPEQLACLPQDHAPLLLLDGGDEGEATWSFLRLLYERIPPPCDYYSIPGADHFCNSAAIGPWLVTDDRVLDILGDYVDIWLQKE
jgi:pimeloyl-ACP methyl ester carboxylesterase